MINREQLKLADETEWNDRGQRIYESPDKFLETRLR